MLLRGVVGYLPANVVQGLAGFLGVYLFTRLLSAESYGRYAVAFGVVSLTHTLIITWIESAMARFQVAEADAGQEAAHARTIYVLFASVAGILPVLAGGVLLLTAMPLELRIAIAAGLVSAAPRGLARIGQERRRAEGDVRGWVVLDVVQSLGGLAIGAALAFGGLGALSPATGLGIASAFCAVVMLRGDLGRTRGGRFEPERARMYAAYAVPLSLSLMLSIALFTTDRFLIAAMLGEAAAGAYHAGYSLAFRSLDVLFIWLGLASVPAAVTALERGGRGGLEAVASEQASLMALITLPAATGVALVAGPLAEVMVGPELRDAAAQVTPWVAVAALMSGWTTYYFNQAFTLAKRTGLMTAVIAAPALANVALNLVLIRSFGLQGALWATVASFALGLVVSLVVGARVLPLPLPWRTLGRAALAAAGMSAAVLLAPAIGGAAELGLKVAIGVAAYLTLALALDVAGLRSHGPQLLRNAVARPA
jgi:O-antigen/teichoic acid export membrane protein